MKKLLIAFLAIMISMSLGLSAYAREGKDKSTTTTQQDGKFVTKAGGFAFKANDIIGAKVENREDKKLGTIKDLAIDPKSERVAFAVVDRGWGDKDVAVPLKSLSMKTDEKGKIDVFVLNMSEDRFKDAPSFDKDSWPDMRSADKSYRYFGQRPYWSHSGTTEPMKKEKKY